MGIAKGIPLAELDLLLQVVSSPLRVFVFKPAQSKTPYFVVVLMAGKGKFPLTPRIDPSLTATFLLEPVEPPM